MNEPDLHPADRPAPQVLEGNLRSLSQVRLDADSELIVASQPYGTASETFRDLRSVLNLSERMRGERRQAMAVISPNSRDGRTFVAANLAVAFSQLGRKTLYVDADLRRPRGHACFKVSNDSGLSEMLAGGATLGAIRAVEGVPNVYVLPAGEVPPNPLELAESPTFELIIEEMRQKFDQVIVDTPAVESGADARVIASKCGSVLAVCRKGKTQQRSLSSMVRWLQGGSTTLCGMVINDHRG